MFLYSQEVSYEIGYALSLIHIYHTDDGGYLYLGPAEYRIDRELEETKLEQDDVLYWVTKSRAVYLQNEPIYVCAILQKVVAS